MKHKKKIIIRSLDAIRETQLKINNTIHKPGGPILDSIRNKLDEFNIPSIHEKLENSKVTYYELRAVVDRIQSETHHIFARID